MWTEGHSPGVVRHDPGTGKTLDSFVRDGTALCSAPAPPRWGADGDRHAPGSVARTESSTATVLGFRPRPGTASVQPSATQPGREG